MASEEVRQKWRAWAQATIGGTPADVERAVDAAVVALESGRGTDAAVAAARAAVPRPAPTTAAPSWDRAPGGAGGSVPRATASVPRGVDVGRVTGFRPSFEQSRYGSLTVWNFRIERTGDDGVALPAIPIQMRARSFDGAINDGDIVMVPRGARPGSTYHAASIRDITTGTEVHGRGVGRVASVFSFVIMIAILAFFVFLAISILGEAT